MNERPPQARDRSGWYLSLIAAAFVAIVVALGYQYYQWQREQLMARAGRELRAVADLKVRQVLRWRQERINDGKWLRDSMPTAWMLAFFGSPTAPGQRATAGQWLESVRSHHQTRRVCLFDAELKLRLSSPEAEAGFARGIAAELAAVVRTGQVRLGDLNRDPETKAVFQALLVPLLGPAPGAPSTKLVGIIALELDPAEFLFPLVKGWPTSSQSGETLLVRREGSDVLFLNDLRHRHGTALQLRLPLSRREVPAVRAVLGAQELMTGPDYRGERVMAVALAVPGTPWFLVAKEDRQEIEEPLRAAAGSIIGSVVALVLLAGATAGYVWRGHARHLDRKELDERRRSESSVRHSETQLRMLLGAMTEMVVLHEIVTDASGRAVDYRILDCNAAFTMATGITHEKAVGALASVLYGANSAPYLEEYAQVAATGVPRRFEVYFPPLDKHFEISVFSPQRGQFGTVTSDVTARRQGEEERVRLNQELLLKNKELEDIIYVASHDLRAPLINVLGFGERLEKELPPLLGGAGAAGAPAPQWARVQRAIGYIRGSATKMDALVRGLLRVSRLGREEMRPGRLDANHLVREALATLAHQIELAAAQVTMEPLPPCHGDAQLIGQAFANLIENAVKYRAPERPLILHVSGQVADNQAIYCFSDTGQGIAAEHQERIWEMFHRLHPGSAVGGEGLGLCIVRRVALRHGGRTWVESTPGVGSRFFVALPRAT